MVRKRSHGAASPGGAQRLLSLMLCFSRDRPTLTARELSEMTGIPGPTVYRQLAVLREAGLVIADGTSAKFHLSVRFVGLAEAAEAADPLIELADPVMRELAAATGETVLLVRAVGQAATCVHRVESTHHLRTSYEPGQPVPFERGASARILIGSMPPRVREAVVDKVAQKDPRAARRLRSAVELAASRGWATSAAEVDNAVWATAAAIYDSEGQVIAALSVPAPMSRMSPAAKERVLEQVRAAADRTTRIVADTAR